MMNPVCGFVLVVYTGYGAYLLNLIEILMWDFVFIFN